MTIGTQVMTGDAQLTIDKYGAGSWAMTRPSAVSDSFTAAGGRYTSLGRSTNPPTSVDGFSCTAQGTQVTLTGINAKQARWTLVLTKAAGTR
ncbi:hypothetical protein [Yinghuangia soli]|uniref:Uncharacterized protein n=1 Tax=Yinghuangia soli TaxID=2908204 RepID=A0AA41U2J6_9ACTN|nr:hypothetical protein [Yinghuangia soli]MCF2528707.1 hypothetical protein [Yinghuangia soli]MCF2531424.1 hypothetical protein [Yinghuangia soli]